MRYIKFLYKDIRTHKILYVFTSVFVFLMSFILKSGLEVTDIFNSSRTCYLKISKLQPEIASEDINKINEVIDKYEYKSWFGRISLNEKTSSPKITSEFFLIGSYDLPKGKVHFDLEDISKLKLSERQKKEINNNYTQDTLFSVLSYSEVKKLKQFEYIKVILNIQDENIIKEIASKEFKTLKVNVKYSKDKNYEINAILTSSNMFIMVILSTLILHQIIKFIVLKKEKEYQIHLFYGSTVLSQAIRALFYIISIFIFKYIINLLVYRDVNLLIDSFVFIIMYLCMLFHIVNLLRKCD